MYAYIYICIYTYHADKQINNKALINIWYSNDIIVNMIDNSNSSSNHDSNRNAATNNTSSNIDTHN